MLAAAVSVLVTWYTSGLGYLMSVVMAPQNSMVAAVATCMIVGGFLNGVEPRYRSLSPVMRKVIGRRSAFHAMYELLLHTCSLLGFVEPGLSGREEEENKTDFMCIADATKDNVTKDEAACRGELCQMVH